ncbi:putative actin-like protein [Trypanosoma theileri]|uniref:Putative actin-like protein n=1 Tax=Trypanosoma theileri TaxID=67003 RepID=A0A1X0P3H1_9TRYP|nr:putative actin-like protein [Trypanosoma theileri]ORC91401.1 putative actin-like protein [Trypanosoma theileri]
MSGGIAVVDVGSGHTRVGLAGEEAPRVVAATLVGAARPRGVPGSLLQHRSDDYAGEAAERAAGRLLTRRPVQGRRVANFDDLEHLLHDALYAWLPLIPSETPLLWVEPAGTTRADRERVCALLFDVFDIPRLAITSAAATTMYATGRTTGIALDSGEDRTTISAVWEGYSLQHAVHVSAVAGRALTDRLFTYLRGKGYAFSTPQDHRLVDDIKCKMCYVAADLELELEQLRKKTHFESYQLPDEQHIYLHESQFTIPEILFTPPMEESSEIFTGFGEKDMYDVTLCKKEIGWAEAVKKVVESSPLYTQSHLYGNIVLGGGNTMFPGIEQRLQHDVVELTKGNNNINFKSNISNSQDTVNCIAFPDRDLAAWIGGSVVASMPTFLHTCLSRGEYHENGAGLIHTRVS